MKEVTISDLKESKALLEEKIKSLLVEFSAGTGVIVSNLRLNTYSVTRVCGDLPTRYSEVEVDIIL